jgi:hypothetical protein
VAHAFLNDVRALGVEEALARVPAEYVHLCESIDLEQLPMGAEFGSELGLFYDCLTDTTRIAGRNLGPNIGERSPTEFYVGIDIDAVLADEVLAADTKTGRGDIPRVRDNWQLRLAVLALARLHGRSKGRGAIIRINEDGEARWEVDTFDAVDLDAYAEELRERASLILHAQETGQAKPTTGPHCRYCPSIPYCTAQTALARSVVRDPVAHVGSVDLSVALTPSEAADLFEGVRLARSVIGQLEAQLYLYAEHQPLELSDGRVYGPVEQRKEDLDAERAREVLRKLHGPEVAESACDFKTSKAGIERALRGVYDERKASGKRVTLKALKSEALEAIREAGGIESRVVIHVKEHRPRAALLEAGEPVEEAL